MAALLKAVQCDITAEQTDAVVNAANRQLQGGSGVDDAIHPAAGAAGLQAACQSIGECPPGQAVITDGFDLPARYIIHTVGPVWQGGTTGSARHWPPATAMCSPSTPWSAVGRLPRHFDGRLLLSARTGRRDCDHDGSAETDVTLIRFVAFDGATLARYLELLG